MYYENSLKFWSSLSDDKNTWPYKTIEAQLRIKLNALLKRFEHQDQVLIEGSKQWTHTRLITPKLSTDTIHQLGPCRLLKTDKPVHFIGDIHSDATALDALIHKIDPYAKENYVIFLGDYVDRGRSHLETLDKLYALKLDLPDQVILLRGNHDGGYWQGDDLVLPYGLDPDGEANDFFPLYLKTLYHDQKISRAFMTLYFDFCAVLPYICLLGQNKTWFMGVHGGLPRPSATNSYEHIKSLFDLTNPLVKDIYGISILNNLFWSDPSPASPSPLSERRRFYTYENHFNTFRDTFGIDQIIRGHQVVDHGHLSIYNDCVHTIFSSGQPSKDTAYKKVQTPRYLTLYKGSLKNHPIFEQ